MKLWGHHGIHLWEKLVESLPSGGAQKHYAALFLPCKSAQHRASEHQRLANFRLSLLLYDSYDNLKDQFQPFKKEFEFST